MVFEQHALDSSRHIFRALKKSGDQVLAQLDLGDLLWLPTDDANGIAIIIRHLHGNMLSRWTDFLTTDGEKPSRERDREFEQPHVTTKDEVVEMWEVGWRCAFAAIDSLTAEDMSNMVTIRGQEHSVLEALHRQMQHISYHVGQMVLLARVRKGAEWKTLSIPRGGSRESRSEGNLGEASR